MRLSFPIHARLRTPERLVLRGGRLARITLAVRYGVFQRPGHAPVLIDAGWPTIRHGDGTALRLYDRVMPARIDPASAPASLSPGRVVLSHLHADHVGALRDLPPDTPIHADAAAYRAARQGGWPQLRHAMFPDLLPDRPVTDLTDGNRVTLPFDLGEGHDVLGDGSLLSVPLPGHATGHTGFLFPGLDPMVLYAADTQWILAALAPGRAPAGPMTGVYSDPAAVPGTIARVQAVRAAGGVVVLAHDPDPIGPFVA